MRNTIIDLYKNAYSGLSKKSWYLSVVMLVNRSGTMVIPFMSIYCTERLHFSVIQAGFIMALFGLGAIFGAYIGGKIVDSIGFYSLQLAALLSGGIMFMIVGYLQTFISLCIGVFILSICNESFRPANSIAIAAYSNAENRTRSYSLNRLSINLGWGIGGALGGFLAAHNYHLLFWVDGSTNIAAAILLFLLLPRIKSVLQNQDKENKIIIQSAYRDKSYLYFIFLVILFATCFFQLFTMLPLFYKMEWHFNEQFIGIMMALNGIIIAVVEMILIHRLDGTKPPVYFIRIGVILMGVGFVILSIFSASELIATISVVFITVGEMLSLPFMNTYWISRSSENNRGQYAALYTIAWAIAQIIAPTAGSQVIEHFSFSILWWMVFAISLFVAAGLTKKLNW